VLRGEHRAFSKLHPELYSWTDNLSITDIYALMTMNKLIPRQSFTAALKTNTNTWKGPILQRHRKENS
jgi:hypothetical protein